MRRVLLCLWLCVSAALLQADPPAVLAIRNARVVTVSGPVLKSGTVVIRNGLIEAVGENVSIPSDAWVLEGEGLTVYPGLIDSLSTWGLPQPVPSFAGAGRGNAAVPANVGTPAPPPARGPEDRPATTPWIHAADTIQPTEPRITAAREAGFTTAVTYPTAGIISGQGAVFNLAGSRVNSMVVSPSAGLYTTLNTAGFGSFPGSLMGVIAYLRQINLDLENYKLRKAAYAQNPVGQKRPEYDRSLESLMEAPRVLMPAVRRVEIDRMVRFGKELKLNTTLYGGHEAFRPEAAKMLADSGVPILVSLRWPEAQRDGDPELQETLRILELRENAPKSPATLAKAGAKFAFYSGGTEPRDIMKAVKKAIDGGLTADQAVRALTLSAAEIYGLSDRIGSIEKGKIANLTITKGDLFDERTKVQYVVIDGVQYEPGPEAPANPNSPGARL